MLPELAAGNHLSERIVLSRLLQLSSTMLPVGAYSYSQGMEWAIECGDVADKESTQAWISDVMQLNMASFELPMLYRLYHAWQRDDASAVSDWDAAFQGGRDTAESLAETRQMGYSFCRLLNDLDALPDRFLSRLNALHEPAFPTVYAGVAGAWNIQVHDMLQAYAWTWLENQVAAAMKTVPLGQVAGQKMLYALGQVLPQLVEQALRLEDDELSNFAPSFSIAGCLHETQYSRLFRS